MAPSEPHSSSIAIWSIGHAGVLLLAAAALAAGQAPAIVSACAAVSFAVLVYRCRGRWTPGGRFGAANAVTFGRLAATLALPVLAPLPAACLAVLLFALDGADGWLARRLALTSDFGEAADKESDALLVLMLCALVHRLPGGPGPWVLAPGVLRYVFVLLVAVLRPPVMRERRSLRAGWISALTIFALAACLASAPAQLDYTVPLVAAMSLLLFASFAETMYELYRVRGTDSR